jgi:transposase
MEEVSVIGLDLAKNVFQAHGARGDGSTAFRKKISRAKVLSFFASAPKCVVAMEACASSHHWARQIGALGHEGRLIAPIYVKPFVKRNKNDAADAEAIAEAASRPTMRFVAVKSVGKASGMAFKTRDLLVRQRTKRSTPYGDIWRNTASWRPTDLFTSSVLPRLCKTAACRRRSSP